jgi:hypothetical protein
MQWSLLRNVHSDQRAVRPSRPQPVPEWCAAAISSVTSALRHAPFGPTDPLPWTSTAQGWAHRTHGGPRHGIDLGTPSARWSRWPASRHGSPCHPDLPLRPRSFLRTPHRPQAAKSGHAVFRDAVNRRLIRSRLCNESSCCPRSQAYQFLAVPQQRRPTGSWARWEARCCRHRHPPGTAATGDKLPSPLMEHYGRGRGQQHACNPACTDLKRGPCRSHSLQSDRKLSIMCADEY